MSSAFNCSIQATSAVTGVSTTFRSLQAVSRSLQCTNLSASQLTKYEPGQVILPGTGNLNEEYCLGSLCFEQGATYELTIRYNPANLNEMVNVDSVSWRMMLKCFYIQIGFNQCHFAGSCETWFQDSQCTLPVTTSTGTDTHRPMSYSDTSSQPRPTLSAGLLSAVGGILWPSIWWDNTEYKALQISLM